MRCRSLFLCFLWLVSSTCSKPAADDEPTQEPLPAAEAPPDSAELAAALATVSSDPPDPEQTDEEGPLSMAPDLVPPERIRGGWIDFSSLECRIRRPLIVVEAVIDEAGRVVSVEFLKEPPAECAQKLIREELATWRFEPAQRDGEPVAVSMNYAIHIQLQ